MRENFCDKIDFRFFGRRIKVSPKCFIVFQSRLGCRNSINFIITSTNTQHFNRSNFSLLAVYLFKDDKLFFTNNFLLLFFHKMRAKNFHVLTRWDFNTNSENYASFQCFRLLMVQCFMLRIINVYGMSQFSLFMFFQALAREESELDSFLKIPCSQDSQKF